MLGFLLQDLSVFAKCVYTHVSVFLKQCLCSYLDKLTMFWAHFCLHKGRKFRESNSSSETHFFTLYKVLFGFLNFNFGSNYNVKLLFSVWLYFLLVAGGNIHCLHIPFGYLWTKCCNASNKGSTPTLLPQPESLLFLPSRFHLLYQLFLRSSK